MNEKIETILKLADLGYSRLEIEKMLAEKPEKQEKEEFIDLLKPEKEHIESKEARTPTHGVDQKDEKNVKKEDEKGEKIDENHALGDFDARVGTLEESLKSIENTLKSIQEHNVRWATMEHPTPKEEDEVSILGSIINRNMKGDN